MNEYLIPANSKKSRLILGFFTWEDIIIASIGALCTGIMLFLIPGPDLVMTIFILLPGLIAAFLVFPVANYHNMKQLIINIYTFYTGRRKYYWRGWCVREYVKDDRKF